MADKKNVNYTNNDGAKYRYSSSWDKDDVMKEKKERRESQKAKEKVKEALTKRSVFWKTNRAFAIFVLVAVILLSSVWSVYRAISGDKSDVKKYYESFGIRISLKEMAEDSNSLVSMNEVLNPDSALNAECRALADKLYDELPDPFWKDTLLAKKLHDKAEAVYNLIAYGEGTGAEAKADAENIYRKIDSHYKSLGSSASYARAAEGYNKTISKFPASIFPIDKAPVFEQFSDQSEDSSGTSGVFSSVFSWIGALIAGLSIPQIIGLAIAVIIIVRLAVKKGEGNK